MSKTINSKEKKFIIILIILVCLLLGAIYVIFGRKNSKYKHIDKDYFTMTSKIELRDFPWTISLEDAKKEIGELDTTYDVESDVGNKVLERLMPKKQIYIDELDVSTEAIRVMFNIEDELMFVDYYFKCTSFDESLELYNKLNKYFTEHISSDITKKEKFRVTTSNIERVKWIDDDGNSLTLERATEDVFSNTDPSVVLIFLSADHRVIYPNQ